VVAKSNYINLKGRVVSALRKIWFYYDPGRLEALSNYGGACAKCGITTLKRDLQVDHPQPVVATNDTMRGLDVRDVDWNKYINRLLLSANEYKLLCKACHRQKSLKEEDARRKAALKNKPIQNS